MHINDAIKANQRQKTIRAPHGGDIWIPARPINYRSRTVWRRVKEAYHVFTGEADALYWDGGQ